MAELRIPADPQQYKELNRARKTTLAALAGIDEQSIMQLTQLTLPEIRKIKQEIAQVLPAGNLPAFILSGLLKLKGRRIAPSRVRQDLNALLRGLDLLPQGLYSVFVAGPAAALYAYQKLLHLAGKDMSNAFPEGSWQFYLQFGLREDTARHANETLGFHQALDDVGATSTGPIAAQMAAAWLLSLLDLLYRYDELLATDWRERVMLRIIYETAEEAGLADQPTIKKLVRNWNIARPYHRPAADVDYLRYRQQAFQGFIKEQRQTLPPALQTQIDERYAEREAEELPAYQAQMSILASLQPMRHQEEKEAIPLWRAALGFVHQDHTYMLPVCQRDVQGSPLCIPAQADAAPIPLYALPDGTLCDAQRRPLKCDRSGKVWYREDNTYLGSLRAPTPETVLAWVSAVLEEPAAAPKPTLDLHLPEVPRERQAELREKLPESTLAALRILRCAPIILNWDLRPYAKPLATIRRDHRGIGDHALTLFRTERSIVFDQSHIFFDGMWGMAVAEIATDSAIHYYRDLNALEASPTILPPVRALSLLTPPQLEAEIRAQCQPMGVSAESEDVNMKLLSRLRKGLRQRGVRLTINDLLLLYRYFHAATYSPTTQVKQALKKLKAELSTADFERVASTIKSTLARFKETNPALLIPMDASNVSPHERLFPTTFRNPLTNMLALFNETQACYTAYRADSTAWGAFDAARRKLFAYLKYFGEFLNAIKGITMRGESFNTATIRLLGHLPSSMQHLLDNIPQRISILNEIIKGNEVFSNVGRVARGSTLHRFISAKDDGKTKELVWGILTDDQGVMHISLRDFREFVPLLLELDAEDVAETLAQDYLNTYIQGFNRFVEDLSRFVALQGPPEARE